jgi:hypothetical protein
LKDFANIKSDNEWAHFGKRYPEFFPSVEHEKVANGLKPSIADYPYCLDLLWMGTDSPVELLLGIDIHAPYCVEDLMPDARGNVTEQGCFHTRKT